MKNEVLKRFHISVLICALSCAITMAKIDPIPSGWTLVEDDNLGWTIQGGASYISTGEIPQLKQRLPQGNNTHIGIWEYIGAQAGLAFEGTGVRIYGYQPGEGGKADIYIDEKLEASGVLWNPKAAFEPDHHHPRAWANSLARPRGLITMGFLGCALLPVIQGRLADMETVGLQKSFAIAIIPYALVLFYALKGHTLQPSTKNKGGSL